MRLGPEDLEAAAQILEGRVHRTPCLSFRTAAGPGQLTLKCENLQKTGAFKARGALHFLLRARQERPLERAVTYSSGNHGGAVAWASRELGIPATIFVPETIPGSKLAAIEGYGARAVRAGTSSEDRRIAARDEIERAGGELVPPFDHVWIVAGQGTAGLELCAQHAALDRVYVPVGGGGLCSGVAVAVRAKFPGAEIVGVEPEDAASMAAALRAGGPTSIELGESIADGLRPVQVGALCYALVKELGVRMTTVTDDEIRVAMKLLFERARLVVEPSGAASLAAWLAEAPAAGAVRACVLLSGGNLDLERATRLLAQA